MKLLLLVSLLVTGSLWSQTQILAPMPAQTSVFSGNVRGYWFTAPTCFTITGADVPTDAGVGNQNIAIVRFNNGTPPVFSATTNDFTTLFLVQNGSASGIFPMNIQVEAGDIIGVLGSRAAAASYSNAGNTTTIEGNTVALSRLGMQFSLAATAPQQLWTEASSNISRVNLYYDTLVTYNLTSNETVPGTFDFANASDTSFVSTWDYGDGTPLDTADNTTHSYVADGTYNVCTYITSSCGTDTLCTTVNVCVNAPVAAFSALDTTGTVTFTDNSTNVPVSWAWDFGDGNTGTTQSPTHVYAASGTYTACLIATNVCGFADTLCQTVTVCIPTTADFQTNNSSFNVVDFTDFSSLATSWAWDFGDGDTSTTTNPSHTYAASGTYNVCLIAAGACAADTICTTVTICYPVTAGFSDVVSGDDVAFTNTSVDATDASWDFGDGNTSTSINPVHTYTSNGSYTICLIASSACSADTVCDTVTLCPETLTAAFTSTGTDLDYVFTNTSAGASQYVWDFGDGGTSTNGSPSHTFLTSGTYTVCLQAVNECGDTNEICNTITVTVTEINELTGVSSIEVYPNPFTESTTIMVQSTELEGQFTFEMIDVTGKVVATQSGDFNQSLVIQKNNLTPDLYFYRITQNGVKIGTGKLIVQ
jgi:PKD repeat protein